MLKTATPATGTVTYPDYLELQKVLDAQHPRSDADLGPAVHAAEHFFIVLHQAFELWLAQMMLDIRNATEALAAPNYAAETALDSLGRAGAVQHLLVDQMALFAHLAPADFLAFRPVLGTASGSESVQYRQFRRLLGLRGSEDDCALYTAFKEAVEQAGFDIATLYQQGPAAGVYYRLAEALIDLSETHWLLTAAHVHMTARTMGMRPGTGGTSGVAYLERGLQVRAFPELWAVRTIL